MSFSTIDYEKQSQELADVLKEVAEERKWKLLEQWLKMSSLDHLQLLRTVIKGHRGAKCIKISYSVPDQRILDQQGELVLLLKAAGWYVEVYPAVCLLTISNYAEQLHLINADYDEYPYKNFEIGKNGRQTIFNFYVEGPVFDDELTKRLIAFGDHIRVELWDLLIDKDIICKPFKIQY
jgi:hypothetical protein